MCYICKLINAISLKQAGNHALVRTISSKGYSFFQAQLVKSSFGKLSRRDWTNHPSFSSFSSRSGDDVMCSHIGENNNNNNNNNTNNTNKKSDGDWRDWTSCRKLGHVNFSFEFRIFCMETKKHVPWMPVCLNGNCCRRHRETTESSLVYTSLIK